MDVEYFCAKLIIIKNINEARAQPKRKVEFINRTCILTKADIALDNSIESDLPLINQNRNIQMLRKQRVNPHRLSYNVMSDLTSRNASLKYGQNYASLENFLTPESNLPKQTRIAIKNKVDMALSKMKPPAIKNEAITRDISYALPLGALTPKITIKDEIRYFHQLATHH